MDKIKVVVVGYGGMGGYHADKIRKMDKFELLGIYDIKDERRKAAEENGIRAYNSFEEVLADDSAELISNNDATSRSVERPRSPVWNNYLRMANVIKKAMDEDDKR